MKKTFFTEAAYAIGIAILAIGTAFMALADFGMSMIVAPAYVLHLKISEYLPFFSFGMAEYVLQAVLILALALIQRRFKKSYLFSFVTAVLYGFLLDGAVLAVSFLPFTSIIFRVFCYVFGLLLCTAGVALLFNTYISPEAYELFVKEISEKLRMPLSKFKTIYDCTSCLIAILLSLAFWGISDLRGVNWGTIVCAVVNGWLIGRMDVLFHHTFEFRDGLPLRKHFES